MIKDADKNGDGEVNIILLFFRLITASLLK